MTVAPIDTVRSVAVNDWTVENPVVTFNDVAFAFPSVENPQTTASVVVIVVTPAAPAVTIPTNLPTQLST